MREGSSVIQAGRVVALCLVSLTCALVVGSAAAFFATPSSAATPKGRRRKTRTGRGAAAAPGGGGASRADGSALQPASSSPLHRNKDVIAAAVHLPQPRFEQIANHVTAASRKQVPVYTPKPSFAPLSASHQTIAHRHKALPTVPIYRPVPVFAGQIYLAQPIFVPIDSLPHRSKPASSVPIYLPRPVFASPSSYTCASKSGPSTTQTQSIGQKPSRFTFQRDDMEFYINKQTVQASHGPSGIRQIAIISAPVSVSSSGPVAAFKTKFSLDKNDASFFLKRGVVKATMGPEGINQIPYASFIAATTSAKVETAASSSTNLKIPNPIVPSTSNIQSTPKQSIAQPTTVPYSYSPHVIASMANHAAYNSFAGPAGHRQIPFTPSQSIAAVSSTLAPEEGKSSATQEVSNAPTSASKRSTPPVASGPKYTPDQHMVEKAKRAISLISQKGPGGVRVIPYAAPSLAPVATSSSASGSKSSCSPTRLSISSQQAKTVAPLTSPTSTATIRVQEPLRPDRRSRTPSPAKKVQSAPTPVVVVTPKSVPVYIPRPILTTIPSRLIVKLVSPVPVYVAKPIFVRKGGVAHLARGKSPARTKEAPKEVKSRSKTPEPAVKGSHIYLPNPVFTKMSSRPLVKPKTVPVYVPKPVFVTKRGRSPSPAKASKFLATMTPVAAPSSALRVTAEEFVPFGSSDSPTDHALRVTAQEFTPMSPDIDTHGNGTVSSGHSSPPFFGGDPNEAYNPYATPSGVYAPVSMGFGIQASPPIGLDPSAAAWDPMTAYMYTVDGQYIPAAQMFPVVDAFGLPIPGPGAPLFESIDSLHSGEDGVQKGVMSAAEKRNQHRTSRHSSGASKASAKSGVGVGQAGKKKGGKTGVNGLAPGSGPLPHTPTLADFIKVDKKRRSVEVVEKVVPGKSGAGSPSASAGSIGSDFERGPTALAKLEGAVRCPDGTFCQNQDTCPYFHPLEICRFYPKCRSGNACYYIHETGSR